MKHFSQLSDDKSNFRCPFFLEKHCMQLSDKWIFVDLTLDTSTHPVTEKAYLVNLQFTPPPYDVVSACFTAVYCNKGFYHTSAINSTCY